MDLDIMLGEVSQREKQIWYLWYFKSKKIDDISEVMDKT